MQIKLEKSGIDRESTVEATPKRVKRLPFDDEIVEKISGAEKMTDEVLCNWLLALQQFAIKFPTAEVLKKLFAPLKAILERYQLFHLMP